MPIACRTKMARRARRWHAAFEDGRSRPKMARARNVPSSTSSKAPGIIRAPRVATAPTFRKRSTVMTRTRSPARRAESASGPARTMPDDPHGFLDHRAPRLRRSYQPTPRSIAARRRQEAPLTTPLFASGLRSHDRSSGQHDRCPIITDSNANSTAAEPQTPVIHVVHWHRRTRREVHPFEEVTRSTVPPFEQKSLPSNAKASLRSESLPSKGWPGELAEWISRRDHAGARAAGEPSAIAGSAGLRRAQSSRASPSPSSYPDNTMFLLHDAIVL